MFGENSIMQQTKQEVWQCVGKSVQGASHKRSGLVNQDAVLWSPGYPDIGQGAPLILAVSDGHGSSTNFRSDRGSRIAVETAIDVVGKFAAHAVGTGPIEFKTLNKLAQQQLCHHIHQEWLERVRRDWQSDPISRNDERWLHISQDSSLPDTILRNPAIAYGATLLVVLVTEPLILYLQIGDGDILCVSPKGQVTRPISHDARLIANQTTSLCLPNAWQEFQVALKPCSGKAAHLPALILLSTDGYANSFPSEQDFLTIGRDYLEMLRDQSIQALDLHLTQFLDQTSTQGSGDDITLGILQRLCPLDIPGSPISAHPTVIQPPVSMTYQTTVIEESAQAIEASLERLETQHRQISDQLKQLRLLVLVLIPLTIVTSLAGAWLTVNLYCWLHLDSSPPVAPKETPASRSAEPKPSPASERTSPTLSNPESSATPASEQPLDSDPQPPVEPQPPSPTGSR
jgi:hypothetical protein